MAGYTRQDTANSIANGNVIDADVFDDEYNAIEAAFNASTGHTHDGSTGGGSPIEKMGPSQDLTVSAAALIPKTNNTLDIGTVALQFKDAYLDGTLYSDGIINEGAISQTGDSTFIGTVDVTGNTGIDGDFDINTDKFTVANATGNTVIAGTLSVAGASTLTGAVTASSTLDVTGATGIDGDFDINTNKFTVASASGNTAIAGTLAVTDASTFTGAVTASSNMDVIGNVGIDGNFDINTNKFTVASSTGNTFIAGTLNVTGDVTLDNLDVTTLDVSGAAGIDGDFDINTNKFTVASASGNTAIAGTLDVTGDTTLENLTVNGNTTLGDAATDTVTFTADVASNIIPDADGTRNLGDTSNYWANLYADAITTTANVSVGGDITITGNLTVDGTTTTLNTATLEVEDKNIVLGEGLTTAASANGGGITLEGANATITYDSATDRWDFNKEIEVAAIHADVTGTVSDISNHLVDEDNMASNSATKVPSQQSVKAYVDTQVAGVDLSTKADLSGANFTGAVDVNSTMTANKLALDNGSSDWTFEVVSNKLVIKYAGTSKMELDTSGNLKVTGDVTAYGTI